MKKELYCKDHLVLGYKEDKDKMITDVEINDKKYLPLILKNKKVDGNSLMRWFKIRKMPDTRVGLGKVRKDFGTEWIESKYQNNLTDQYFVKNKNDKNTWKDINFFTNEYSPDVGNMFFSPWKVNSKDIDNFSPDLNTNGKMKKMWVQKKDYTSVLVKARNEERKQESLYEFLSSKLILDNSDLKVAEYKMNIYGTELCVESPNFITPETELVPASYIIHLGKGKQNQKNIYDCIVNFMKKNNIKDGKKQLDKILIYDFILGNTDRNLSNLCFIQDVESRKIKGLAPLFDFGNSFEDTAKALYLEDNILLKSVLGYTKDDLNKISYVQKNREVDSQIWSYKKMVREYPFIGTHKKDKLEDLFSEIEKYSHPKK